MTVREGRLAAGFHVLERWCASQLGSMASRDKRYQTGELGVVVISVLNLSTCSSPRASRYTARVASFVPRIKSAAQVSSQESAYASRCHGLEVMMVYRVDS